MTNFTKKMIVEYLYYWLQPGVSGLNKAQIDS